MQQLEGAEFEEHTDEDGSAEDEQQEFEVDGQQGLQKLRKIVRKIRKSTKLKQICDVYEVKPLVPIIDVSTRWNSTYAMIKRAFYLKVPLRALCLEENNLADLNLFDSEWEDLRPSYSIN